MNASPKTWRSTERYLTYAPSSETEELAWKATGDRLQGPCHLSREDQDRKIWNRKQRTDIGKYSFLHRTIKLWNQLPAEVLATVHCKPHSSRERVRRVITRVCKWVMKCLNKGSEGK